MLKGAFILGVGFALGYTKALHDSGDVKAALDMLRNDEELKAAFKDLAEALKRVKESDEVIVVDPDAEAVGSTPNATPTEGE